MREQFEKEFAAAPLKRVFVSVKGSKQSGKYYDPGKAIEGAYKVVGGEVIMCDAHGREDHDGRKYRHTLKPGSGELNEHEAASVLAKDIKSKLKINGDRRTSGFEYGPINYPRPYY